MCTGVRGPENQQRETRPPQEKQAGGQGRELIVQEIGKLRFLYDLGDASEVYVANFYYTGCAFCDIVAGSS